MSWVSPNRGDALGQGESVVEGEKDISWNIPILNIIQYIICPILHNI